MVTFTCGPGQPSLNSSLSLVREAHRPPQLCSVGAHPRLHTLPSRPRTAASANNHRNTSQHRTLSTASPSMMERTSTLRLGCRAAPRSPAEPAAAILHSSRQRPFQSAPFSRRGGSGPHLHRGLNRVKSQSSRTGVRREEGGMKNKTGRRVRGQGDALSSGISPMPPPQRSDSRLARSLFCR